MRHPAVRLSLLGFALAFAIPVVAADQPLPVGARARLGTTRMREFSGWSGSALTPDGKYIVTPTPNGLVKTDAATGEVAGTIGPKAANFLASGRVELAADGKRGLSAGFNGTVVWEADGGKVLAEVKRPMPYGEYSTAFAADGSAVAVGGVREDRTKDKPVTAVVWDVGTNAKRAEVVVVQNQSCSVALSPNGSLLATWGVHYEPNPARDGVDPAADPARIVQFWETATGKELAKVRSDSYGILAVAFSPADALAAVASGNGSIRLVDARNGNEKRRLFGRFDQGFRLAFSPDGAMLATTGTDGAVQLWGTADGSRRGVIESPIGSLSNNIRGIRFTGPDRAVVWASIAALALVWEVPSGKLLSPVGGHAGGISSLAFTADGQIWSGGQDGLLLRWDAATGKDLGELRLRPIGGFAPTGRYAFGSLLLTPDAKSAVWSGGGIGVFELPSGRQASSPVAGLSLEFRPFLCPDARTLIAVPNIPVPPKPHPKSLRAPVWDSADGAKLAEIDMPAGDLIAAAVTPDRTKLITAVRTRPPPNEKGDFRLTAWDLKTSQKLGELVEPDTFGSSFIVPAADNATALVYTYSGKLAALDLTSGKLLREFDVTRLRLSAAPAFSPDGKRFAASLGSGTLSLVRIFDWETGQPAGTVRGHAATITCAAFSPDGRTLATGSTDTTVLLWDLAAAAGK